MRVGRGDGGAGAEVRGTGECAAPVPGAKQAGGKGRERGGGKGRPAAAPQNGDGEGKGWLGERRARGQEKAGEHYHLTVRRIDR